MYKTLADMTPEQRAACVGMWCDVRVPFKEDQKNLVILTHVDSRPKRAKVFGTGVGMTWSKRLQDVTPRCDLPRAWNPDGEPVPGEWEDGHVFVSYDEPDPWILKDTVSIEGLSEGGMSYYEEPPNGIEVKLDQFGEGEGKARRWVGEWEQA